MNRHPVLAAGSLVMEPLVEKHLQTMWRAFWESRSELRPFLVWVENTHSPADLERFICRSRVARDNGQEYVFVIQSSAGDFLGVTGLHNVDRKHRSTELGFWVHSQWTGRGICTATSARLLRLAFGEMNLHRVFIRHARANEASRKVIERLGFTHEGTARDEMFIGGQWMTHETYSMLETEYQAAAAKLLLLEEFGL
jgi:ribosomal-protein-serine acetyltransferase